MPVFFSPEGNPEIWAARPEGYLTEEEWVAAHPDPEPEPPTLDEARAAARAVIQARYEAALTAGLTMPSAQAPASALELALAIADWQAESPEDFADLRAIHTARRDELLAAVAAAESVEAVRAVEVSYAV